MSSSDSEPTISQQDKLLSFQYVSELNDTDCDVELWYGQMDTWRTLNKITDDEELYRWSTLKVKGKGYKTLISLVTTVDGKKVYPTLEQIRNSLSDVYEDDDITDVLKEMKIEADGNLKEFNKDYMKLYEKLDGMDKFYINVTDYLNSIENKVEAWKGVQLLGHRASIKDAMETAEKYENIQIKMQKRGLVNATNKMYSRPSGNDSKYNASDSNNKYGNKFHKLNGKIESNSNTKNYKVQTCFFCNKPGHIKMNCPEYQEYRYFKYKQYIENYENQNNKRYNDNRKKVNKVNFLNMKNNYQECSEDEEQSLN